MTRFKPHFLFALMALLFLGSAHGKDSSLAGSWTIDRQASTALDPWSRIDLEFSLDGEDLTLNRTVSAGRRTSSNSYSLKIGETVLVDMGWWTGNRHIGAYVDPETKGSMKAEWLDDGSVLRIEAWFDLVTSQGTSPVRTYSEYRLSPDGETLTLIHLRSTRNKPIVEVYHRSEVAPAKTETKS